MVRTETRRARITDESWKCKRKRMCSCQIEHPFCTPLLAIQSDEIPHCYVPLNSSHHIESHWCHCAHSCVMTKYCIQMFHDFDQMLDRPALVSLLSTIYVWILKTCFPMELFHFFSVGFHPFSKVWCPCPGSVDPVLKLADFGFARALPEQDMVRISAI